MEIGFEDLEGKRVKMGVILRESEGALEVEKVLPGSPAEKSGIAAGDRLVSVEGVPVTEMADVQYALSGKTLGDRGTVVVLRDGQEKTFELEFARIPTPKDHP